MRESPVVHTLLPGRPPELVVYSETEPCPYLEGETARMPLRMPVRVLTPEEVDLRLAEGDRRHGRFLYRPTCPTCRACEAIRLDAERFTLRATHRRVLRRGDQLLRVELGEPHFDPSRMALYNAHKRGRALMTERGGPIDERGYRGFLVARCVPVFEMRYFQGDALVGVAVVDRGADSLSAVYTYYDPERPELSIGTYSILKQLELCRRWGLRYLYLGLYIHGNAHMRYKGRFLPHERLVEGRWREYERGPDGEPVERPLGGAPKTS